ncbi:MAG: hypothetical protein LBC75_03650 [Fibromonadaceae bacterium]|nr:hypothetical protein [Fibromonadaceae bacterium]
MVLRFFMLAAVFCLSCTTAERDNCWDSGGINYGGCAYILPPDSSGRY